MLSIKEASKIALEKHPGDTIIDGFEYKNLCIFHMLVKGADVESSLNYYASVNKDSGGYDLFDIWHEGHVNPKEFFPAIQSRVKPDKFA